MCVTGDSVRTCIRPELISWIHTSSHDTAAAWADWLLCPAHSWLLCGPLWCDVSIVCVRCRCPCVLRLSLVCRLESLKRAEGIFVIELNVGPLGDTAEKYMLKSTFIRPLLQARTMIMQVRQSFEWQELISTANSSALMSVMDHRYSLDCAIFFLVMPRWFGTLH